MKNKKYIKIFGVLIVVVIAIGFVLFFKNKTVSAPVDAIVEVNPYLNSNIEIKTFQKDTELGSPSVASEKLDSTSISSAEWGYDILIDGNIYIHQPNIPAIGGGDGFKTQQDAQKTAEIVVNKIRKNIIPPSIDLKELQDLGVIK